MEPSDAYYKAKRSFLLFAGVLILAVFVGIRTSKDEQKISILPFSLEKPELITWIFAVLVFFYVLQFSLQWAAQRVEVQRNQFHRLDFFLTMLVGTISLVCFCGGLLRDRMISVFVSVTGNNLFWFLVGGLISVISSLIFLRASTFFGRYLKQGDLSKVVTSGQWVLHHNPDDPTAKKVISFESDGSIQVGRNQNESNWRVRNGLLEILNDEGQIFSRFRYVPRSARFVHTNDPDTLSRPSQTITILGR